LPTTMGIVAGLLVQNTLKYLLKFGEVSNYVGYNALEDFFPSMTLKPNTNCDDSKCLKKQELYQQYLKDHPEVKAEEVPEEEVVHEDNEWGISLVAEDSNACLEEETNANLHLAHGVKVAYTIPSKPMKEAHQEAELDDTSESLDELMSKMKNI